MSSSLPPPSDGDVNEAPIIWGLSAAMTALSLGFYVLRLYTRVYLLRAPGLDDFILGLSLCIIVASTVLISITAANGLGRHAFYLSDEQLLLATKWDYITAPTGIMGVALPKLAVVVFINKIVEHSHTWAIRVLYFLVISNILLSFIDIILFFAQCSPPYSQWDPSVPHTCWSPSIVQNLSYFVGAFSAFCDLCLALYPIRIVKGLQMPLRRKLLIAGLMGFGLLAFVCATGRTAQLGAESSVHADFTWLEAHASIWTEAEMNVIVICACLPTLLPLFQQVSGRRDYRSRPSDLADQTTYNGTRLPFNRSISLRPLHTQGSVEAAAYYDRRSETSVPNHSIKAATQSHTQWESV